MKRIMIVDDSGTARMFVRRCFEIVGHRDAGYVEAANGEEALAKLKDAPADLLVTDLTMPVMDGRELLTRVKASPRLTDMPVMIVTSAANEAAENELLKQGAQAILHKPVNPATLSTALEPLLPSDKEY